MGLDSTRPTEITYDQGSEFIGHGVIKYLFEIEYRIVSTTSNLGNPISNAILKRIHQVLGNLVQTCNIAQTYADEDDPWSGILSAAYVEIRSTTNRMKVYSTGQLVFGCDMVLLIKRTMHWKLIRQRNQTQINKVNIRKNRNQVDHDYIVGDKVMLNNNSG